MPEESLRRASYIPGLDGIRAIAATMVLLSHARLGFVAGGIGVDMFFVLSGFLITGILVREQAGGRIDFRRFYWRRALRLFPAYLVALVVTVVASLVLGVGGTIRGAAFSFLYLSNWAAADGLGLGALAHTWSLSIEEQFYLVWPALIALVVFRNRRWARRAIWVVAALAALAYGTAVVGFLAGMPAIVAWNSTFSRGSELLVGALLAVCLGRITERGPHTRRARVLEGGGLVSLVAIVVLANVDLRSDVWVDILARWPVVSALTVVVILASLRGRGLVVRLLESRPMVAVGRVSYGLYLWNFPIFVFLDSRFGLERWDVKLAGLALTAAVVPLSYFFIEKPFLRLKDRPVSLRRSVAVGDQRPDRPRDALLTPR